MIVQACHAYVPEKRSLAATIASNPSIDLVAGKELHLPSDADETRSLPSSTPHAFATVTSGPILELARDKVIGQRIAFATTGLAMLDKTLPLTKLNLPENTDEVFEIVGLAISTVDTCHEFTRQDRSYLHQGLSLATTLSCLTKALSPVVPALQPYQPAIESIALVLKFVRSGGELVKREDEYRVLQLTMRP